MKKEIIITAIMLVIFIFFGFYWFQVRPSNIRKNCAESAIGTTVFEQYKKTVNDEKYKSCLKIHGIEK